MGISDMAKDALGHGSNARGGAGRKPIPGHPYHAKTSDELRYIQKDAHEAGRNAQEMGDERGINKYADQVNDAATVLAYRDRGGKSDHPADQLAGGPKSAPVPTHDSMTNLQGSIERGHAMRSAGDGGHVPGFAAGGRHGYSPDAVNNAIAASNRAGRRIGGKEAAAIHRLLKGR
jgi:hypothetical protein